MIDDAPALSQINIDPEKFTTHIYYSDGSVSGTVVGVESNRILVTSEQIPKVVKDCFVAIEDKRFYEHDGIDLPGIARAGYSGIKSFLDKSGGLLDYGATIKASSAKRKVNTLDLDTSRLDQDLIWCCLFIMPFLLLQYIAATENISLLSTEYTDAVTVTLFVSPVQESIFIKKFTQATNDAERDKGEQCKAEGKYP